MASGTKRAWKLQEFTAHGANVNCLALGKKSGRVLVTGGDDKKVNLWAVGKQNCIMSLSGHTTPVECVTFGHSEELVCAGSMSGALKIWDLEAAKIVRTLTGHKANISCLDFHPYGEFLASGSVDTNIKLWDIRRKGCIFTYKGHKQVVNSLKFSPDGRWIASGGEDGVVKLWDLQSGKMLAEFSNHMAPVNDVQFHPNEFLLASGSSDKTVKFWDLESFQLVSSTDPDSSAIRCIYFNANGECLFSGAQDLLKVYGWEPARVHDSLNVGWGKVAGFSSTHSQLIAATHHLSSVSIHIVDLKRLQPFSGAQNRNSSPSSAFQLGTPMRKSFIRRPPVITMRNVRSIPIDQAIVGVDMDDESVSSAEIKAVDDYKDIFQPRRRELTRTPPMDEDLFPAPSEVEAVKDEPQKLHPPQLESRSIALRPEIVRSEPVRLDPAVTGLEITRTNNPPPLRRSPIRFQALKSETFRVERQFQIASASAEIIQKHVSVQGSPPSKVADPLRLDSMEPLAPRCIPIVHANVQKMSNKTEIISIKRTILDKKVDEYVSDKEDKSECDDFVPAQREHSVGLDVDEFLPLSLKRFHDTLRFSGQQKPEMSEAEAISSVIKGHDSMVAVLVNRQRNLQIVHTIWASKDLKTAMDSAVHMNDMSVIVDIVSTISFKPSIWSLDLCVTLLPSIYELLQSKYETYMSVGCTSLRLVLRNFGAVIRSNISAPHSLGIDLSREERYNKCMSCYNKLMSIRAFILKRQTLQGKLGHMFRELHTLLQILD